MNDLFCTFEQSLKLKELGFDESCFGYYTFKEFRHWIKDSVCQYDNCKNSLFNRNEISAPLKLQVFKWFRDELCINGDIISNYERYFTYDINGQFQDEICSWNYSYKISWTEGSKDYIRSTKDLEKVTCYEEYSEAEKSCINQLIKLIDEKV